MAIRSREANIGAWAFAIGVVLAIVTGIASSTLFSIPAIIKYSSTIYSILVVLGLVVGFMNIRGRDTNSFMLAGAVLVIVSRFGMESVRGSFIGIGIGDIVNSVFSALLILFVPATIIVALKIVFDIAKV